LPESLLSSLPLAWSLLNHSDCGLSSFLAKKPVKVFPVIFSLCSRLNPAGTRYEDPLYPVGVASTNVNEEGLPLTYGSVIQWTDLSLEYRLSLKSRWISDPEWLMWPAARVLVRILAVLHVVATVMNTFVNLIMDNPLLIFETLSTNTVDNHEDMTHSSSSDHQAVTKVSYILNSEAQTRSCNKRYPTS
jgi:hypothetical protein